MRITQGTFSFLPDLSDEQIEAQIRYALEKGWALGVEYTDDPHPRNPYWEMWNLPLFDLAAGEADIPMREVQACRKEFPDHYIKVTAYDARHTKQTTALSFIVNRPDDEPGFRLERADQQDRTIRYTLQPYSASDPVGRRYRRAAQADDHDQGGPRHPSLPDGQW